MHISKLTLVNYRNFKNSTLAFTKGVNTIIGENGSGKTNVFRAIRLLLDDNMIRSAFRLDETDFHRGRTPWQGHWIIISLEFDDVGPDEAIQALFLHGTAQLQEGPINRATYNLLYRPKKDIRLQLAALAPGDFAQLNTIRQALTIDNYETVITGRSEIDFSNESTYAELVGNFDTCHFPKEVDDPRIGTRVPTYLSVAKEVSFTFVQALRDVVSEFHNNRTNPLLTLLRAKSGDISAATMEPIVGKVKDLNTSIEALEDVQTVRANIRDTIKDAVGETYSPTSLSIKSDLPDEAERLFQSLRLFVGESEENYEGAIHELSLGGANLIFLTLKLLEFKYQKANQSIANFLLIEEPEAHIHTHVQRTLFDRIAYADTQIIYSTHSTHISEVSNVESMNILGRSGGACESFRPAVGLTSDQVGSLQRYLDAVRNNLLFAKSVVLVEGDAEEILVPILFKRVLGLSLDELGISLINIRSTGFKNVAVLFHDDRVRKRCGIITDLDTAVVDTAPVPGEPDSEVKFKAKCLNAQTLGVARMVDLAAMSATNQWIRVFHAIHTMEVDFVSVGNAQVIVDLLPKVYTQQATIDQARDDLMSGQVARYGRRVLTMAEKEGKGWFAILLGKQVGPNTRVPSHIRDAIFFARPALTRELFFNVYSYRLKCAAGALPAASRLAASAALDQFRGGHLDLPALKAQMFAHLPGDQIHDILANVA